MATGNANGVQVSQFKHEVFGRLAFLGMPHGDAAATRHLWKFVNLSVKLITEDANQAAKSEKLVRVLTKELGGPRTQLFVTWLATKIKSVSFNEAPVPTTLLESSCNDKSVEEVDIPAVSEVVVTVPESVLCQPTLQISESNPVSEDDSSDEAWVVVKPHEGKPYYWDRSANTCNWALPAGIMPMWVSHKAGDGRTYYTDRSGKSCWVMPALRKPVAKLGLAAPGIAQEPLALAEHEATAAVSGGSDPVSNLRQELEDLKKQLANLTEAPKEAASSPSKVEMDVEACGESESEKPGEEPAPPSRRSVQSSDESPVRDKCLGRKSSAPRSPAAIADRESEDWEVWSGHKSAEAIVDNKVARILADREARKCKRRTSGAQSEGESEASAVETRSPSRLKDGTPRTQLSDDESAAALQACSPSQSRTNLSDEDDIADLQERIRKELADEGNSPISQNRSDDEDAAAAQERLRSRSPRSRSSRAVGKKSGRKSSVSAVEDAKDVADEETHQGSPMLDKFLTGVRFGKPPGDWVKKVALANSPSQIWGKGSAFEDKTCDKKKVNRRASFGGA